MSGVSATEKRRTRPTAAFGCFEARELVLAQASRLEQFRNPQPERAFQELVVLHKTDLVDSILVLSQNRYGAADMIIVAVRYDKASDVLNAHPLQKMENEAVVGTPQSMTIACLLPRRMTWLVPWPTSRKNTSMRPQCLRLFPACCWQCPC